MLKTLSFRKTISRVGFAYFTALLLVQIVQGVAAGVLTVAAPQFLQGQAALWLLTQGPMYLVGLPVAWLILRTLPDNAQAPAVQPLPAKRFLRYVAVTFAIVILGNMISLIITTLIGLLKASGTVTNPLLAISENSSLLATFLVGGILVPMGEEFLFRFLPYKKLAGFGSKTYILVTALVFSYAHGNLSQMVYAFFVGALLAYLYANTGKLFYCMVLHIIINCYGMVLAPMLLENPLALGVLMVCVYALVITGIVCIVKGRKLRTYPQGTEPLPEHPVKEAFLNPGMLFLTAFTLVLVAVVTLM